MNKKLPDHGKFSEYDHVWTFASLAKPGKHTYYIIYKLDEDRIFKTITETIVNIR